MILKTHEEHKDLTTKIAIVKLIKLPCMKKSNCFKLTGALSMFS